VTDIPEHGAAPAPATETSQAKRRRRHGYLGCLLGLACAFAGLAAGRLGNLWIAFDVFSQGTLQFVCATVAFTIGLFLPRGKIMISIVLLICMILGISVWPYYASQSVRVVATVSESERALHVATFNVWYFNNRVDDVKAEIARIDADVFAVIEFNPVVGAMLDQLKSRYPFQVRCPEGTHCELAILSKYPVNSSSIQVDWTGPDFISANLGNNFGGLTIFAIHTTRFPHPRAQLNQMKAMAAKLETIPGPQIVMGDMNATPFSRVVQTLATSANLGRLTNLPTWPARLGLPQVAIDHIFASPAIHAIESERIGNNAGSDHFPIFMKLAVPVK
jgi:endonuclease/exonuclease/phosphatase (EEP) superfamily protein YafD